MRVVDKFIGETQTCAIPDRSIHGNLYLICSTIERVGKITDKGRALVHLDQSKAYDKVPGGG